jgi:hypothetical protein
MALDTFDINRWSDPTFRFFARQLPPGGRAHLQKTNGELRDGPQLPDEQGDFEI